MSSLVGIHMLALQMGTTSKEFEDLMTEEVFPTAAQIPGSINRAGQSSIESQHLLKSVAESSRYLWLVKSSGVFEQGQFSGVFNNMYEAVRDKLETLATRSAYSLFTVVDSLDLGPRDASGKPAGDPVRGSVI